MPENENEKEREIKRCLKTCYKEDKRIMLDESIFRIKGITLYIYDLIYFGNKIIISSKTMEKVKRDKNRVTYKVYSDNCTYLLKLMEQDTYGDYSVVDIDEYGSSEIKRIIAFLRANPDVIYFFTNVRLYNIFVNEGVENRVKLFDVKTKIISICRMQEIRYDTLGFISRESGNMFFKTRSEDVLIKAFTELGYEKPEEKGKPVQVNVGDIILIRKSKDTKYTFNLYKIISNHSRHFAVHIIWTDLLKGHKTNFYVKRLDEIYQRIIFENA